MNENSIILSAYEKSVPGFVKNKDNAESFNLLKSETERKIKACFKKLKYQLSIHSITLQ